MRVMAIDVISSLQRRAFRLDAAKALSAPSRNSRWLSGELGRTRLARQRVERALIVRSHRSQKAAAQHRACRILTATRAGTSAAIGDS